MQQLRGHLESRYGIRVERVVPLDQAVFRVDRHDGASWVARVFPEARPIERADGDAAVLRFLEQHAFPAERCARPDPVSSLDGQAVLVTEHVEGTKADSSERTLRILGEMLGRLQTLPEASGVVAREAGSLHHWSADDGGPEEDLAAAMSWLTGIESRVPAPHRARYESLRDHVARTDDCHTLPRALVHPDFHPGNVIATPGNGPVVVDWTGAGRGPRVASLAVLLYTAVVPNAAAPPRDPDLGRVDAVVAGYRDHVRLDDEEVQRLPDAVWARPLVFACFLFWGGLNASGVPAGGDWSATYDLACAIAARAGQAFAAD